MQAQNFPRIILLLHPLLKKYCLLRSVVVKCYLINRNVNIIDRKEDLNCFLKNSKEFRQCS